MFTNHLGYFWTHQIEWTTSCQFSHSLNVFLIEKILTMPKYFFLLNSFLSNP
jgi:hypothetical protein